MSHQFAKIMFTNSVKAAQEQYGSRARLERFSENAGPNDELTDREAGFIALRDTFYLAYADFRGNTQLVSVGNVSPRPNSSNCRTTGERHD